MDTGIRDRFVMLWQKYCPGAELPITFEIGEADGTAEKAKTPGGWRCIICDLARVRKGASLVFDRTSVTCSGGLFYMGYETHRSEHFRYFLSSGKPSVVEGERYKRTPEIVDEMDARHVSLPAVGRSYTFRRWDKLALRTTRMWSSSLHGLKCCRRCSRLPISTRLTRTGLSARSVPGAPRSSTIPGSNTRVTTPGLCSGCSIRRHVPASRWIS